MPYPQVLSSPGNDIKIHQFDHDMHGGSTFDKQRLVGAGSLKKASPPRVYPLLSYFEGEPLAYKYTFEISGLKNHILN